ncbi:flagellar basal-body rod protein FlgF [Meinhardsimonia xiamenensis]|jgi:flagellar basal-body rod protein FlgF|uniref:Flagellar basal-body rod protein FlgF n=1 Tax=Meinhardsimonia xiamenensis TaxID=990712 RepID=A0A1G9E9K3_9RHOB|nr:flagellar hook-basal body complex protein [Meinhardsimonia xiamenensis]PRX33869.1 flagellar basal-body rod protein FlgF [Meinhardsimonia xiamenensis]SDK72830.1 flagellar basal-body rod protein FlgF [Meinhardsimonia xiamenensis]
MANVGYVTLTRLSGLKREFDAIAQNVANMSTTGYRREGVIFSEFIARGGNAGGALSMAAGRARVFDMAQGGLQQTGGRFDFAIEGEGFFLLETPDGPALTRAGSFTPSPEGELVAPDGARLLDAGGAPIFVPPDARNIALATDGTLTADGQPIAQVGLYAASQPERMSRLPGARFAAEGGVEPVAGGVILQGFLEGANVQPVTEIARMIEVQHAYEAGRNLLEREDERIRDVLRTLGK